MRWLLLKDLQILRRSPLVTVLLVLYPIAIAVLIGFALSRGPEKPRVAFVNQVPAEQGFSLGGGELNKNAARDQLCERVECVDVSTVAQARSMVQSGDVLGALILPRNLVDNLNSLKGLTAEPAVRAGARQRGGPGEGGAGERPDPLADHPGEPQALERRWSTTAAGYLDLVVNGGHLSLLGQSFDVLGLQKAGAILTALSTKLPADSPYAQPLQDVIQFAGLARQNLNLAKPILSSVAHPIVVAQDRGLRLAAKPRLVRHRRGGNRDADVRHGPARGGLARAGAGGERLPAPHPRAGLAVGAARREGRPRRWSRRWR